MSKRLILASASPRRRELLGLLGLPFEVVVSEVEENGHDLPPEELAAMLAENKAREVCARISGAGETIVLGADTVVAVGRSALGKPADAEEARQMLTLLSGRTHTVITGISLATGCPDGVQGAHSAAVCTDVTFRALTPAMMDAYIATGEPFDKAGGYGIQGHAAPFVERIDGDYFNVVGLPVATVGRLLEEMGMPWWRGPAALDL